MGEAQRTNLQRYSEQLQQDFTDAGGQVSTVSANDSLAPDGTMTADTIVDENTVNDTVIEGSGANSVTNGTIYTYDFYAKKHVDANAAGNKIIIRLLNGAHDSSAHFNLIGCSYTSATGTAAISHKAEPAGDGWCRMSVTFTALQTSALNEYIYLNDGGGFLGTGTKQVSVWGMGLAANSFMTTYCGPTTTSSVTCTADSLTMDPSPSGGNKRVLADTYCATCAASKLTIEFQAKCEWSSSADSASSLKYLIGIAGGPVHIYGYGGRMYFDRTGVDYKYAALDAVNYSNWHTYKFFIDYADLARSYVLIDGVPGAGAAGTWTGTATMSTSGNIYIGSNISNASQGNCSIKNLRVESFEF